MWNYGNIPEVVIPLVAVDIVFSVEGGVGVDVGEGVGVGVGEGVVDTERRKM